MRGCLERERERERDKDDDDDGEGVRGSGDWGEVIFSYLKHR
jgi:hypothetical protein